MPNRFYKSLFNFQTSKKFESLKVFFFFQNFRVPYSATFTNDMLVLVLNMAKGAFGFYNLFPRNYLVPYNTSPMREQLLLYSVEILLKYVSLPQDFSESIKCYPKDAA